jgi:hypothetical protein
VANPLAWLPFHGDTRSRRAAMLGVALVLSLLVHVGLPFVKWQKIEAVSEGPITVQLMPPPPMPLPEADELKPVPNEEESPAPPDPEKPAEKDAQVASENAVKIPPREPPKEPVEEDPLDEPVEDKLAELPPLPPTTDAAARLAALEKRRAERLAERERRRQEREARRAARLAKGGAGGERGGAPPTGDWRTGTPESSWLCNATDRGTELHVTKERPLSEWVAVVPTVLGGFQTRPSLGGYLNDIKQVISRDRTQSPKRIGFVEMSLPNEVLQIELEEPRGVRIAVGRLDARCLIGFKYASGLFPFSVLRAPVRIIDGQNNSVSALVDVTFYKDVSLEVTAVDGTELPFKRARLKNGNDIQRNIQDHYEAARLAKGLAELLGIQLTAGKSRPIQTPQSPPARASAKAKALAEETTRPKRRVQE